MCFYADADWYASVTETDEGPAPKATKCSECRKPIAEGEWRYHVWQQEHEECQTREEKNHIGDDDEEVMIHDCIRDKAECEYGETFDYDCCISCKVLRNAIRQVEEAEGCTGNETEPALPCLFEDVSDGEGWGHYVEKFRAMGLTDALAVVEKMSLVPAEDE